MANLLTSGAWIFRVDSIVCIYVLYNLCKLLECLVVVHFAVRSILNLSRSILSRFMRFMVILSIGGLGKAIMNSNM